jgi:hypothetical protein
VRNRRDYSRLLERHHRVRDVLEREEDSTWPASAKNAFFRAPLSKSCQFFPSERQFRECGLCVDATSEEFVNKGLQIRIFNFGGGILKLTDCFVRIADHDFDVVGVEFGT